MNDELNSLKSNLMATVVDQALNTLEEIKFEPLIVLEEAEEDTVNDQDLAEMLTGCS